MVYMPPIKPLPPNADDETRRRMYWEYVDLCVATNPSWFLPVGVRKRWWHLFKIEHPETTRSRDELAYPITPAPVSRPPHTRQSLRAAERCREEPWRCAAMNRATDAVSGT